MTEADWLASADPLPMLAFLRHRASERKLRLLAVAACHEIWDRITDERSREAVAMAEKFADGLTGEAELLRALDAAHDATDATQAGGIVWAAASAAACACYPDIRPPISGNGALGMAVYRAGKKRRSQQCRLVRCVFGPLPFHPLMIDPVCMTPTKNSLAGTIYSERAFDHMPILADALEEAGCTDADILNHCRGDGPHARGCWVVDLILGKQ